MVDNKIQDVTSGLGQTSQVNPAGQPVPNPQFNGQIPPAPITMPSVGPPHPKRRKTGVIIVVIVLLLLALLGIVTALLVRPQKKQDPVANRFDTVQIPLDEFLSGDGLALLGTRNLTINGRLQANDAFIISPSTQPANGTAGQIYYDQTSNELAYFNGTEFIELPGDIPIGGGLSNTNGVLANTGVLSLQGQTGNVTLTSGGGIAIDGTTLTNTGVTSIGGATGAITLGSGLTLTDNELRNSGVNSLAAGTPNLIIADDGAGNLTISDVGGGSGTVTSGGGTAGRLAKFTGVQNIEDSLISESGTVITVNGDLTVTGSTTLNNALTVGNGGTGATSLAANGVVISHGASALTAVTSGGVGECLLSTAGAPAFGVCPGGGGVASLNGLTGALTIANASAAGSTITLNDASTTQKGIAQFNATNFTASGGTINTVQDIHTGASPTFVNQTLTGDLAVNGGDITSTGALNITPGGTLVVGASSQTLTLQGGASTSLSATSGANATVLNFEAPTANVTYRLATASAGTYDVCSTAGNCAGVGGGVTTAGGTVNRLAKFTAAQGIGDSTISDNGTNVTTTVDLIIQGGDVTVGVASSQTGTINLAHSASGFLGTITQGALTGNRTYTLPDASGTVCLTSGNCSGGGSSNTLQAAYDAGNSITTTDARDIDIILANTTTDSNLDLVVADGSTSFVSFARANGAGTADPAQMLLVENQDLNRALPIGIKIQSAAGGMTTGIDASDAELVDAINVGANNIVGTTGDLNFTNFDVTGATGNITTAGDLALNGGDITSTGAISIANGAGNVTINSTGTIELQDSTNIGGSINVTGNTTLGDAAADTVTIAGILQGATPLVFEGGTIDANQLSLAIATLTSDKTITFGDETGTVCLQNSANCGFTTSTTAFIQNGNSFGTTATLGTNDSNNLNFETSGVTVVTIQGSNGAVNFINSGNSTAAFNVETLTGDNLLTADTANSRVGINLGASNTPTLASGTGGLEVNGALRISGITSAGWDQFVTPIGSSITSKINVFAQTMNPFGQIMALGLNSGSSDSARGLSLFDARTVAHQPTLAVFSPDENSMVGFSWNGSNAVATVQTGSQATGSTDAITLQSGNVTAGNGSSGEVIVTSGSIQGGTGGSTGLLTLQSGNGAGTNSSSGNVILDSGVKTGSGTTGTLTIAGTNASALTLGRTGLTTNNAGTLTLGQLGTTDSLTYLCRNTSNVLAACNTTGTGAAFVQGGNSFTATAVLGTNDAFDLQIERGGATKLTVGANNLTLATNIDLLLQGATAYISNQQGQSSSEAFGLNATVSSTSALAVGNNATATGQFSTALGDGTEAAFASTAVGRLADASGQHSTAIGAHSSAAFFGAIAIGESATATANNQLIIGGPTTDGSEVTQAYIGSGVTDVTPANITIQGTGGSGANVAGANVTLAAGKSTGSANGGSLSFQISAPGGAGSTLNSLTTVASLSGANGAATFQNATNSADAFRIINAASDELVGVDSSDSIIRLLANNTGHLSGTGATWTPTSSLPAARSVASAVTVNGYVYSLGGCDSGGGATPTVYYTRANSDGTLGSWTPTTSLPANVCGHAATTYNGYIYVNGSTGSAVNSRDVYYAKPNADGTISSWATQNDPTNLVGLKDHGMAAYNGFLYITAGATDDGLDTANKNVYYARIMADGSVPSFTVQSNWLSLSTDHNPGQTLTANGFLYVMGSPNYDKFFYGRINSDGSVAAVAQATGTTDARKYASIAVMNGFMYAIAGGTGTLNTIQYAPLANSGDIGAFTTDTTTLSASYWLCPKNAVTLNNYIYMFGCADSSDVATTTVQFAGGARVKVGGGLDLVGYSGEGMSDGGTGGQLTAGNTFVNGLLSVTGNTNLKDGATVGNALNVIGTASIQTTTNTTTGFQVLNAASIPQFVVDTSNSRVYVGNPTADATGALLVLDTKNTTGDPTGVAGAIYYNSAQNKFRCFENSIWQDCTYTARTSLFVSSDFMSVGTDSYFLFGNNGQAGATNDNDAVGSIANHPGVVTQSTGTTSTGRASIMSDSENGILLGNSNTWRYETVARLNNVSDATDNYTFRAGFIDENDIESTDGCFFRYNHGTFSGNWQGVCRSNSTETSCNTAIAMTATSWYRLTVAVNSAGTSADFQINGTSACTVATNIPTGASRGTGYGVFIKKSAGTTARTADVDYMEIVGQIATPR